jgi:C4-type Zn-finger protein
MPDSIEAAAPASLASRIEAHLEQLDEEETLIARIDERLKRLAAMKEERKLRVQKIRRAIANEVEAERTKTLRLGEATVSMADPTPALHIASEDAIPGEFLKVETKVSVDKAALLEAITKDGLIIDGVSLKNGAPILKIRRL